jgi:hypothetical protein
VFFHHKPVFCDTSVLFGERVIRAQDFTVAVLVDTSSVFVASVPLADSAATFWTFYSVAFCPRLYYFRVTTEYCPDFT